MKTLIISNLYPPYYHGGYEVRCSEVAKAMLKDGHEVRVLTTMHGLPLGSFGEGKRRTEVMDGVRVDRCLYNYAFGPVPNHRPWTLFQAKRELSDAREFVRTLREFKPDIVNWWNMNGVSKILLPLPRSFNIPDVHWIEYPWMIDEYGASGEKASPFWVNLWDGTWGPKMYRFFFRWIGRHLEQRMRNEGLPTRQFPNRPSHVCFVSDYLRTLYREAGLDFSSSEVIYGGVSAEKFYSPVQRMRDASQSLRVLWAGQVTVDRGLHTAVEAIGLMPRKLRSKTTLSVAGYDPGEYFDRVKTRVSELGLTKQVVFLGKVSHIKMPEVYKQHDVLVFLSTREEGLPLVMAEAMLAGCAVVTTGSGGAIEVAHLANLPLIAKGDPSALSQVLSQLAERPEELIAIAERGQKAALQDLTLDRMMERLQATLARVKNSHRT